MRSVECVDSSGIHNTQCDPDTRPESVQNCEVGIPCASEVLTTEIDMRSPSSENPLDSYDDDDDDAMPEKEVEMKKSDDEEEENDSEMQGDDPIDRNYQYRIPRADHHHHHLDPNPVPNEPT